MRFISILLALVALSSFFYDSKDDKAPDFQGISAWVNSEPLQMNELKGKVVLVDFWSYSCINCVRTFPYLKSWYEKYKDRGLVIIGVHTPEFTFEKNLENVKKATKRYGIDYPVALDNDYKTWRAYNNRYWPTSYLIDQEGNIVLKHIGEGKYLEMENAIRKLLGLQSLTSDETKTRRFPTTPEIYLGSYRAQNYINELVPNTVNSYSFKTPPTEDRVGLKGLWRVAPESITAAGSDNEIVLNFSARRVHAVIAGASDKPITLLLDGKPLAKDNYTEDMDSSGQIYIHDARKYDLCKVPGDMKSHILTIKVPAGISFYTFTFGSDL